MRKRAAVGGWRIAGIIYFSDPAVEIAIRDALGWIQNLNRFRSEA
jgi:hypothetical protein